MSLLAPLHGRPSTAWDAQGDGLKIDSSGSAQKLGGSGGPESAPNLHSHSNGSYCNKQCSNFTAICSLVILIGEVVMPLSIVFNKLWQSSEAPGGWKRET